MIIIIILSVGKYYQWLLSMRILLSKTDADMPDVVAAAAK